MRRTRCVVDAGQWICWFSAAAASRLSVRLFTGDFGATYTDDQFQSNYDRAQGSNLELGVYHVYSYTTSPRAQLQNFTQEVSHRVGQLPIAVQVGTYSITMHWHPTRRSAQNKLQQFISLLQQRYDKRIIIWCTPTVWRALNQSELVV